MKYRILNLKRLNIIILFVIIGLLSAFNISAQDYSLNIDLQKVNYLVYENILFDVIMTNTSSGDITTQGIDVPNNLGFSIELQDASGNVVGYTGFEYTVGLSDGVILTPNEQLYHSYNILSLFGSGTGPSGPNIFSLYFPYLPVGYYTLDAELDGVSSNILSFNIVNPSGDERIAYDLILDAFELWEKDNSDPAGQALQKIAYNYPNSVYAENCYLIGQLFAEVPTTVKGQEQIDLYRLEKEMLQKYPNSGSSLGFLRAVINNLEESEKESFLNKIITDNPDSRSAKFAKQILKRIEQKKVKEK